MTFSSLRAAKIVYKRHFRWHLHCFLSTDIVGDKPILVRDFIRSALYDPNHGYFSKMSGSVGQLESSIRFNQLQGRVAYLQRLSNLYKQHDISWFTPVELFKPWYAFGIAEAIMRTANLSIPLKIYEIGGGSGTCAKCIMDYMMLNAPAKVYNNMTYVSVEISQSLAKKQLQTVGEVQSHLSKFRVERRDATDRSGWGKMVIFHDPFSSWGKFLLPFGILSIFFASKRISLPELYNHMSPMWPTLFLSCLKLDNHVDYASKTTHGNQVQRIPHTECLAHLFYYVGNGDHEPCWVIMLEVLDNLPHDLVYSPNQVSPWMEVWLEKVKDRFVMCSQVSEVYKPIQDSLIAQCVKIIGLDEDHAAGRNRLVSAASYILSRAFPKPRRSWIPTGCLQLLEVLHSALPKMSLIASDFSYLPEVSIPGDRAPLVSTKKHGRTTDHGNYLDAKGDADIFFPTDFWLLERIDHYCSGWSNEQKTSSSLKSVKKRRTIILDTASFMDEFGLPSKTRTRDGYNPLLDDFKNTKFYLSVPTHNIT
ncbi:hypothetical protein MUK42_05734 [Musa troglodytarum]|uniref:Protein arginine methyltransferase NDUFAF7 n=1 Tax=Musa troglodytarum TaxID=320322 RepID=A0A9E7EHB4_9LILI|nr:hypothetical protein MUK42_05734 [Musa troglodytarum]